jgi:hypothetical protein
MAAEEMLVESLIRDLDEARKLAFSKGRPSAAVTPRSRCAGFCSYNFEAPDVGLM